MARRDDVADLEEFGRFAEPALLILVSLADGPKHGYAITEDIADFADVRFGPGSLYGAIARLESRGLIEALEAEDRRNPVPAHGGRREGVARAARQHPGGGESRPEAAGQRVTWLIRLYPPAWRRRYGRELAELLAAQPMSFRTAVDLVAGAVDAWLNPQSSTAVTTTDAKGAGAMLPKMLQLRSGGYGPDVTVADSLKAAAVTIGGTLALVRS